MDHKKAKLLIVEWVKIEKEITKLDDERKKLNKAYKEKKEKLKERQKEMENPILRLMENIDTDSIGLGDGLTLNSKQVSKTTGLNQKYIKQRIEEYFGASNNNYLKLLRGFCEHYNINLTNAELQSYLSQFQTDEVTQLHEYITDVSARKIYFDDEILKIGKKRGKAKN